MQIADHEPVSISDFKGLFGRGEFEDTVPPDHFLDSLNTISDGQDIVTRDGFLQDLEIANIRRIWEYRRQGEASRLIILTTGGTFYDSAISLVAPILTVSGATDFSAINQYNRAYISPHNGVTGLSGEYVYVYSGSGSARAIAGTAPASGFDVAVSASAGNIPSGTHIFGVAYETDSGFITAPGQLTALEVDGTKSVDLSSIPTGPTGTSKRRIVASRAIQQFNGDVEGYEMFFLQTINDNSTTTLTVNFYDADLQISCDYLFDQLATVPSVVNITSYSNRLVFIAPNANASIAYVSKTGEPESISELSGFVTCDPSEPEGLKTGVEFRDNLYLAKYNKLYATRDNGYDPSTWAAPCIDKGIGADVFSLSVIQDNKGANLDFFLLGDRSGLYIFNGTMVKPELSYKIMNWWKRINKAYFNKVQIAVDTENFRIYILVPLDEATHCSHFIVGDFGEGFNHEQIRWHLWGFTTLVPECFALSVDSTTKEVYLRFGDRTANTYNQDADTVNDDSVNIETYVQMALLYVEDGWVHHLVGVGLRIKGSGNLDIDICGEDESNEITLPPLALAEDPGREYFRPANYNAERISIKLYMNGVNEYFELKKAIAYLKPVWATRPG